MRSRAIRVLLVRHALERRRLRELVGQQAARLRAEEERLHALLEKNADGMLVIDPHGDIRLANPAAEAILNRSADALTGRQFGFPLVANDTAEIELIGPSGEVSCAEMRVVGIEWEGRSAYLATLRDITARHRIEEALRESEERYALAARGASDGLFDWNLKSGTLYFSPRWTTMLGYEEHEVAGGLEAWLELVHPDDRGELEEALAAHVDGFSRQFESEYRVQHRDGTWRWMLARALAVRDPQGRAVRMAGSQTDVTERKEAQQRLLHNAFHSSLTGLPNRTLFMNRLTHAVDRARRRPEARFATLYLDVDRFKHVNDCLGHTLGDHLLVSLAQRISTCLRPGDTIAHMGADEFAILIEDIDDVEDAVRIATRIEQEVQQPFDLETGEVYATISIGITVSKSTDSDAEEMLRDANTAMNRAKSAGRSRIEIFDLDMHLKAEVLLQLENDLRRAVEHREFRVHYQAVVNLLTGKIAGFEALVRWEHPRRGLVPPNEFIPLAEETGLIIPIGQFVLEEACLQMQRWHERFPAASELAVSVNISPRQFSQPRLVDQIRQALERSGLPPRCLKLEITESGFMDNAETATAMLVQLRAMGVQLQIDDFGTGYSCLSHLHRFPIHTLKIDQSFVRRMGTQEEHSAIVRTIVALGHMLGLDVTAEGVETAEQAEMLRRLECEFGQGYYYSKPVASREAEGLIAGAFS